MDDLTRLREALGDVEKAARGLPWAKERPWRVDTHVFVESDLPVIDCHDLGTRQTEQVCDAVIEHGPHLQAAATALITGRGRHSVGPARLPQVVRQRLGEACRTHGWRLRIPRAGRFVVVIDPKRAPAAATGALGWGFWLWVAFVAAAVAALFL